MPPISPIDRSAPWGITSIDLALISEFASPPFSLNLGGDMELRSTIANVPREPRDANLYQLGAAVAR